MTTSQKAAISLLVSVLFVGVFTVFAFTGLFDLLETRYYNPSIVASVTSDNAKNAEIIDDFLMDMQTRFLDLLDKQPIRRSLLPNQDLLNIHDRSRINNNFIESSRGIQWIRFIDSGGTKIHFSSYDPDILLQEGQLLTYKNYNEPYLPYDEISVNDKEAPKYTFDARSARILLSFPLYDSFKIYWGTALISISVNTVLDRLISEGKIRFGQDAIVISSPPGLLFGMTISGERALPSQISSIWREEGQKTTRLVSPASGLSLVLFSTRTSRGVFVGRLLNEEIFFFPQTMKFILLAVFLITVFLIAFLLLNLRQDTLVVVQNRLKRLQISLIEQFLEYKGETDWRHWIRDLELRRDEIIVQVKQGIDIASSNKSADIDILINKYWDELLSVLGGRKETGIDEEKLQSILKNILVDFTKASSSKPSLFPFIQASSVVFGSTGKPSLLMKASAIVKELEETETVEDLEELEEADAAEEPGLNATEDTTAKIPEVKPAVTQEDIYDLASKIEFSSVPESDLPEEESLKEDLEIVSPFSTILNNFSGIGDDTLNEEKDGSNKNTAGPAEGTIQEHKGVPYVSDDVLYPGADTALNQDFKELVDSVIK